MGCFCVLAVVNNFAVNTGVQISLGDREFMSYGIDLKERNLDPLINPECGHWAHSMEQRGHRHLSTRGADLRQEPTGVTPHGPPTLPPESPP